MKRLALMTLLICGPVLVAGDESPLNFKNAKVGSLPKGLKAFKTGKGEDTGGDWKIVEDKDAPGRLALAQTKADKAANFNICVAEDAKYKDIDFTVSFKAIAGERDQGGGPVWRFQDGNNYYVCRMNPLEDNFRVYKVVAGKRKEMASADVKVETGTWHTIRIVHKGDHIECYLDGKKLLDVNDDTFREAGKIGVWTKADAQTRFTGPIVKGKKE